MNDAEVGRMWDENAEVWSKLARRGYDVYRDLVNTPVFFAMLPEVRGLHGLDIGCGEGNNTRLGCVLLKSASPTHGEYLRHIVISGQMATSSTLSPASGLHGASPKDGHASFQPGPFVTITACVWQSSHDSWSRY